MNENKFTPRAEAALRLSQEAAGDLGHGYVGTEHLLLGLLREGGGVGRGGEQEGHGQAQPQGDRSFHAMNLFPYILERAVPARMM